MNRSQLFWHILNRYGVEPEYPWADSPDAAVFRHSSNRKWFALVMQVQADRLGLPGSDSVDVLNLKCDPRLIGALLTQPGFRPAYHMNKNHWVTVLLGDQVPDEDLKSLLDMSYDLTAPQKRSK